MKRYEATFTVEGVPGTCTGTYSVWSYRNVNKQVKTAIGRQYGGRKVELIEVKPARKT